MDDRLLLDLRLLAFAVVAVAAVVIWLRRRGERERRYLAASFVSIFLVLALSRLRPFLEDLPLFDVVLRHLVLLLLILYPWLLAAFAWSFAGPLPRWLRAAPVPALGVGIWAAASPPAPAGERAGADAALVVAFVSVWVALSLAAALRLWSSGAGLRAARARMRLLAVAVALLSVTLIAVAIGPGRELPEIVLQLLLPIAAAGLFLAGFAPPRWLRLWWHRDSLARLQDIQVELARATTVEEVAGTVIPELAHQLGAGVVLLDRSGGVLAAAALAPERTDELARIVLRGEEPVGLITRRTDGAWLLVEPDAYTPIFASGEMGVIDVFIGHLRLVLERARLFAAHRDALEAAERARRELETTVYGLAHDLKNPTIALAGFAQLLTTSDDPADRREMAHHVERSVSYIQRLVDALLELSRVGQTLTEAEPVDLADVAERVAERARAGFPEARVTIEQPLPVLRLNRVRAEQLLDNLVGNAVRHGGRPDVTVHVGARLRDSEVQILVSDDGAGVPPDDRDRIFELFQRGAGGSGGSGIGLAMVRRIATSYDGSVELAPDGASGSTFVVSLPQRLVAPDGGDYAPRRPAIDA